MKPKWAIEPYDPKAYLTAYNFDPVIKESLNCLNELHKTKTLCDHEEEIFAFDITDPQSGINQAMDIQIWFDESEPEQLYCEIVSAFIEEDYWCRGDDYQSLWTVHKDHVQEFLDHLKVKPDAISDNNKPSQEDSNAKN